MARVLGILVALAACGRSGFEAHDNTGDSGTGPDMSGPPPGDMTSSAVCGDGTCAGNDGELCNTCASDCKTTNTVCGNGDCEAGEAAAGCEADCGPASWPWTAEEAQLAKLVNDRRAAGFKCPGTAGGAVTRPPLTVDAALEVGARSWAWEIAHQNFWLADGSACNGRTVDMREAEGGFTAYISSFGFADVQTAFDDWLAAGSTCTVVMSDVNTVMYVAVAMDVTKGYIFVLK